MLARCPECEEDTVLPEPPEGPEVTCSTCGVDWAPGGSDPDPGWRVPVGGPQMWARVLVRYDSEKPHRAFIEFCAQAGALDYAARRYRRALRRSCGADDRAEQALERLQALAYSALSPDRAERRRPTLLLGILGLLMALGVAVATAVLVGRLSNWQP